MVECLIYIYIYTYVGEVVCVFTKFHSLRKKFVDIKEYYQIEELTVILFFMSVRKELSSCTETEGKICNNIFTE